MFRYENIAPMETGYDCLQCGNRINDDTTPPVSRPQGRGKDIIHRGPYKEKGNSPGN